MTHCSGQPRPGLPEPDKTTMRLPTLLLSTLLMTAGCAASTYPLNPQIAAEAGLPEHGVSFTERVGRDPDGASAIVQRGACSWYGPGFHGRRTSNGEVFDKHELTAAHPTLPFGSELEVTDMRSGNTVRVRVNDRGPFVHGRILDLSYGAASSLGIIGRGVADVRLRLVDLDESSWPEQTFALEVASFSRKIDADKFVREMTMSQRAAALYYVKLPAQPGGKYSVRFGPFPGEKSARSAAAKLERVGLRPSLKREDLVDSTTTTKDTTDSSAG